MYALSNGHIVIAQLLLEAGADKEAKNKVRNNQDRERERNTHTHRRLIRWFAGGSTVWPPVTTL
jgi:ankyrin repeat protein